jgi:hypothetical protein
MIVLYINGSKSGFVFSHRNGRIDKRACHTIE